MRDCNGQIMPGEPGQVRNPEEAEGRRREGLRVEMSGHKGRTCRLGRLKRQTWEGRKDGEKL